MQRKLVWIVEQRFWGWGCSECAWVFSPSGSRAGVSMEEMKRDFEQRRYKDFATHVCADHPRAKNTGIE